MNNLQSLSLYHLGSEYQRLLPQLYDHETGEINAEVDAQLNALSPSTEKKCIAVASWVQNMEAEKKQIAFLKEQILRREDAYNREIKRAMDYLETNMKRCGIQKVESPFFTLRIKNNPYSTDILDEALIPAKFMNKREFVKTEIKPDRNAIKEEVLKTGEQVPGALVHQKTKLEIIVDKI